MMHLKRLTAAFFFTCGAALWAIGLPAAAAEQKPAATPALEALRTCTECHDKAEPPVLPLLKSKHAVMADKRTPFADKACIACHGASEQHRKDLSPPDITFRAKTATPVEKEKMNGVCISCHQGGIRMHWAGSTHQSRDLACSSCHKAHAQQDPVRDRQTQREVCFNCHTPHGSNHTPLLKTRLPYLCQQCHLATFHPSTLYSGTGLPPSAGGTAAADRLLLRSCENCHSQIHGSNHPSGARFQR